MKYWGLIAAALLTVSCGTGDLNLVYPGGAPETVSAEDTSSEVGFSDTFASETSDTQEDTELPGDSADPPSDSASEEVATADTGQIPQEPVLRVAGRFFRDETDRIVLLRGINVAGTAKVPPFASLNDMADLDPLRDWGFNVIRLLFIWEAYEPQPGEYNETYLQNQLAVAEAAWERGLFVVVDIHQDGFSRHLAGGCGSGFPLWALPPNVQPDTPDNSDRCHGWHAQVLLDPDMHATFSAFYADTYGVRTRYLEMLSRISGVFRDVPGVVGYDLFNEPWGWEKTELGPLYEDAAVVVRAEHPTAILFVEGHVTTNTGVDQTGLEKPTFDNFAYAPHFYDGAAMLANAWSGLTAAMDLGFWTMTNKAEEWDVPLVLGEFGLAATAGGAADYVAACYARLDEHLASGMYWNYSPRWSPSIKDGWNGEDFSVVDDQGAPRATLPYRGYARRIAGLPQELKVTANSVELAWKHQPTQGRTELFVPFEDGEIVTEGTELGCWFNEARIVHCQSTTSGDKRVTVLEKGGE